MDVLNKSKNCSHAEFVENLIDSSRISENKESSNVEIENENSSSLCPFDGQTYFANMSDECSSICDINNISTMTDTVNEIYDKTDVNRESTEVGELRLRIRRFDEENSNLRNELLRVEEETNEHLQKQRDTFNRKLDNFSERYRHLEKKYEEQSNALSDAVQKEKLFGVALEKSNKERDSLLQKLDNAETKIAVISSLEEKLELISKENIHWKKQYNQMQKEVEGKTIECKQLHTMIDRLAQTIVDLQKSHENVENNEKSLLDQILQLKRENMELKAEFSADTDFSSINSCSSAEKYSVSPILLNHLQSTPIKPVNRHQQNSLYDELKASGFSEECGRDDSRNRELEEELTWYENEISAALQSLESTLQLLSTSWGTEYNPLLELDSQNGSKTQQIDVLKQMIFLLSKMANEMVAKSATAESCTQIRGDSVSSEGLREFQIMDFQDHLKIIRENPEELWTPAVSRKNASCEEDPFLRENLRDVVTIQESVTISPTAKTFEKVILDASNTHNNSTEHSPPANSRYRSVHTLPQNSCTNKISHQELLECKRLFKSNMSFSNGDCLTSETIEHKINIAPISTADINECVKNEINENVTGQTLVKIEPSIKNELNIRNQSVLDNSIFKTVKTEETNFPNLEVSRLNAKAVPRRKFSVFDRSCDLSDLVIFENPAEDQKQTVEVQRPFSCPPTRVDEMLKDKVDEKINVDTSFQQIGPMYNFPQEYRSKTNSDSSSDSSSPHRRDSWLENSGCGSKPIRVTLAPPRLTLFQTKEDTENQNRENLESSENVHTVDDIDINKLRLDSFSSLSVAKHDNDLAKSDFCDDGIKSEEKTEESGDSKNSNFSDSVNNSIFDEIDIDNASLAPDVQYEKNVPVQNDTIEIEENDKINSYSSYVSSINTSVNNETQTQTECSVLDSKVSAFDSSNKNICATYVINESIKKCDGSNASKCFTTESDIGQTFELSKASMMFSHSTPVRQQSTHSASDKVEALDYYPRHKGTRVHGESRATRETVRRGMSSHEDSSIGSESDCEDTKEDRECLEQTNFISEIRKNSSSNCGTSKNVLQAGECGQNSSACLYDTRIIGDHSATDSNGKNCHSKLEKCQQYGSLTRSLSESNINVNFESECRSRRTKCNQRETINENECPTVFPSLTDVRLQESGIAKLPDANFEFSEKLTEDELSKKYTAFSIGLSADRLTLKRRLALSTRQRDQSERNFSSEVQKMQQDIQELAPLCTDRESIERVERVRHRLDMIAQCAHRVSCTAETLGAMHQETRVSRAVLLADRYLQILRGRCDKLSADIAETKRILAENNIVIEEHPGELGDELPRIRYRSGVPSNNRMMMARRRASIAAISRPMGTSQDVTKEGVRQRNSVSGRVTLRRPSLSYEPQRWENEKLDRTDSSSSSIGELKDIFEQAESRRTSREENNNVLRMNLSNNSNTTNNGMIENDVWVDAKQETSQEIVITEYFNQDSNSCIRKSQSKISNRFISWRLIIFSIVIFFFGFYVNHAISYVNTCNGAPPKWWSIEELINRYAENRNAAPKPI